uniref:Secreted protein n=1 Tax=Mycena chlorophos TaxID=658473 RepID=A0ABQ0L071_MYCCL|nr:predicted protein [Mycena chlorophos]
MQPGRSGVVFLALVTPLVGALVRLRANYAPRRVQLPTDASVEEGGGGPVARGRSSYFGMLKRVHRIEVRQAHHPGGCGDSNVRACPSESEVSAQYRAYQRRRRCVETILTRRRCHGTILADELGDNSLSIHDAQLIPDPDLKPSAPVGRGCTGRARRAPAGIKYTLPAVPKVDSLSAPNPSEAPRDLLQRVHSSRQTTISDAEHVLEQRDSSLSRQNGAPTCPSPSPTAISDNLKHPG